ncbi:MAG: LamG-like jellyroll fold domain-containing protein, partial [Planctomycetota bacterium]
MSKKLIYLFSFVLVLALTGTNVVFASRVWEGRITFDFDDVEERVSDGGIDTGGSDLEMPYEEVGKNTPQVIGLRFLNIDILPGVTIDNAYIEFQCDELKGGTEAVSLLIEGDLSPDAAEFISAPGEVTSRPRTAAQVVWVPADWTSIGQRDQTSDITSIIDEIINQPGWVPSNALVLIISDDPANPSTGLRCAEAGPGIDAAMLHIEWSNKRAMDPDPADGDIGGPAPFLQWTPGDGAALHDVYFGTNPDLGSADYMGRWSWAMYWHAPGFTPGTTYYWRIDEVEADGTTIHTGDVWSFTSASLTAHSPSPADNPAAQPIGGDLSWGSGATAVTHDVYFGTNRADVAAGTGETFKGNQPGTTYTPEVILDGTTHHWRIDEVEADGTTKHTGEVWTFRTLDDAALVGWWKFDEGQGVVAYDSTYYGHDGTLGGNPQWVAGAMGGGLELDEDDDYVAIDAVAEHMTNNDFSVSIWVKTNNNTGEDCVFASNETSGTGHSFIFGLNGGNVWSEDDNYTEFPPGIANGQWHMITYVRDGGLSWIYVDGVLRGEDSAGDDPASDTRWSIGQEWDSSPSDEYKGAVDDARFWIRPITAEEVAEVFKGDFGIAQNPSPFNNLIVDVDRAKLPLTWSPGELAAQHDVYFGTDEVAVKGADASDATGIYRGRQTAASYIPTEALAWGTGPYYWRIDEYNTDTTISKGAVWSFTVADYLIVDDIESYNDLDPADPASNRIFNLWLDG